jgi:hypothetical protein
MSVHFKIGENEYKISHAKIAQRLAERCHESSVFLNEFKSPQRLISTRRPFMRAAKPPRWVMHYEQTVHSALLGVVALLTLPWSLMVLLTAPLLAMALSGAVYVITHQMAKLFSRAAWRGAKPDQLVDRYIDENYSPQQFSRSDVIESHVKYSLSNAGLLGKLMMFMATPGRMNFASVGLKGIAILFGSFAGMSLLGLMPLSPLLTLVFVGLSILSWVSGSFGEHTSVPVSDKTLPVVPSAVLSVSGQDFGYTCMNGVTPISAEVVGHFDQSQTVRSSSGDGFSELPRVPDELRRSSLTVAY